MDWIFTGESQASLVWISMSAVVVGLMVFTPQNKAFRAIVAVFVSVMTIRYLVWRITDTLPSGVDLDWQTLWRWSFGIVECLSLCSTILLWIIQSRYVDRSRESTEQARRVTSYPMIDVFIPTYNEEQEIIERTAIGAIQMKYPRFRVWILDDSRRDFIQALANDLSVGYLRRSNNLHAKAGNMNNAIAHVMSLDEPPSFIAILDADFIPLPTFLARTVPLFNDEGVGIVQTPQHFFNPDPMQVNLGAEHILPDDQRFAQMIDLPARDAWGIATSCGTSSIVRVAPLLAIGGFPYESVCEDTLTSIKFWTLRQRTVVLNEFLTHGLAVEGVAELLTQRGRWALGNMQIVRSAWGILSRHRLPVMGRLFILSSLWNAMIGPVMKVFILAAPAVYLYTGALPIPGDSTIVFSHLLPFILAHYLCIMWISHGAHLPIITEAASLLEYFSTWRASLDGLSKPLGHKFKVTAKGIDASSTVVHWTIVRPLSYVILIYLVGIALNVSQFPLNVRNQETLPIIMIWCVYNMIVILFTIIMAIDLPRARRSGELRTQIICSVCSKSVELDGSYRPISAVAVQLSNNSATLIMPEDLPGDEEFQIVLPEMEPLSCRVVSRQGDRVTFAIASSHRRALSSYLFDGRYKNSISRCNPLGGLLVSFARLVTSQTT